MYLLASSLAAALFAERRVLARRGWVGEKAGLFEHPVVVWVFLLNGNCGYRWAVLVSCWNLISM
jgi:hypothetical protein